MHSHAERGNDRRRRVSHSMCWLIHRFREQARSHNLGLCSGQQLQITVKAGAEHSSDWQYTSTVGAGLPAMAVYQPAPLQLTHRHRRQASSHI